MERLYCTINEEQARIAHDMMSMSDYKVGSKTEEYKGYVDKVYDLAEKVAEARPREADRVEALAKRYSFSYDFGCWQFPSEEKRETSAGLGEEPSVLY